MIAFTLSILCLRGEDAHVELETHGHNFPQTDQRYSFLGETSSNVSFRCYYHPLCSFPVTFVTEPLKWADEDIWYFRLNYLYS